MMFDLKKNLTTSKYKNIERDITCICTIERKKNEGSELITFVTQTFIHRRTKSK